MGWQINNLQNVLFSKNPNQLLPLFLPLLYVTLLLLYVKVGATYCVYKYFCCHMYMLLALLEEKLVGDNFQDSFLYTKALVYYNSWVVLFDYYISPFWRITHI